MQLQPFIIQDEASGLKYLSEFKGRARSGISQEPCAGLQLAWHEVAVLCCPLLALLTLHRLNIALTKGGVRFRSELAF